MARKPVLKLLCAISLGLALLIGAFFLWIHGIAERRWAVLESRVSELEAEARGRDPRRPPRGRAVPGNAWEDYQPALAQLGSPRLLNVIKFVNRKPDASREAAEAELAAIEGEWPRLRAGTRREEGAFPSLFDLGVDAPRPYGNASSVEWICRARSRILVESGRPAEAVEMLMDALWFCADVGRNSTDLGLAISALELHVLLDELRDIFAASPGGVDWDRVAQDLAKLDGAYPKLEDMYLNEGVIVALSLMSPDLGVLYSERPGPLDAWRHGFSPRLMIVDAVEKHLDVMGRLARACGSWAELERTTAELSESGWAEARKNWLFPWDSGSDSPPWTYFVARTRLRLLRAGIAARAGKPLTLDDPLGGALKSDDTKIWSAGQNGRDDGGAKDDIVLKLR